MRFLKTYWSHFVIAIAVAALVVVPAIVPSRARAQTGASSVVCNPGDTINTFPCTTVVGFDNAYWNSQPPPVRALRDMPQVPNGPGQSKPGDRMDVAMQLAKQGYTIDVPIMAWAWDAYTTMKLRDQYGYTWVPSALQAPVYLPPGLSFPGLASYNATIAPPGSIKVDFNPADYAPAPDLTPAAPPPATDTIGPDLAFQVNVGFGQPVQTVQLEVRGSMSTAHLTEGFIYTRADGSRWFYHLLGTELMDPTHRIGIWLGPLPPNAAAPFAVTM